MCLCLISHRSAATGPAKGAEMRVKTDLAISDTGRPSVPRRPPWHCLLRFVTMEASLSKRRTELISLKGSSACFLTRTSRVSGRGPQASSVHPGRGRAGRPRWREGLRRSGRAPPACQSLQGAGGGRTPRSGLPVRFGAARGTRSGG